MTETNCSPRLAWVVEESDIEERLAHKDEMLAAAVTALSEALNKIAKLESDLGSMIDRELSRY